MDSWMRDLRYSFRRLRARPLYAFLTILTLALGVGGTAAVYSIVHGLLLTRLPYAAEEEILVFWNAGDWTEQEFLSFRPDWPGFQKVAAYRNEAVALEVADAPVRLLNGIRASAELFDVLEAKPELGHTFVSGDDAQGAEPVIVLGYRTWQDLGGGQSILGRRIRVDGVERTVIGVMPSRFRFPDPDVQAWLPQPLDPNNRVGNYTLIGRMSPGLTLAAMKGPLDRFLAVLGERFQYSAQWDKTKNATLTPIRDYLLGSLRPGLFATLAAMGLILLIASANVAALMLGQLESRSSELAVQTALGASRSRLIQQLVIEAVVIGALAGIIGAAIAAVSFRLLLNTLPLEAWAQSLSLHWSLFFTAMAIAFLASILIGAVPAIVLPRRNLRGALTQMRSSGISGGRGRMESGLVVAEVALAVIMAVGAGLLIHSVSNLYRIDPGLDPSGVAVVDVALPKEVDFARRRDIASGLLTDLGNLPGVHTVSLVQQLPLRGPGNSWGIQVEGSPSQEQTTTYFRITGPRYFEAMGIRILQGRGFDGTDRPATERVVVINEAAAKKYFPGEDPLGRMVSTGFGGAERIVGVVENVAEADLTDQDAPARYMLYDQIPYVPEGMTFVLRMAGSTDPAGILGLARTTIEHAASGVAIRQTTTMEQVFAKAVGPARQVMMLLTLLTTIALFLGAIGVYGVISHLVHRRKRDWGIRIALGLQPSRVIGKVLRQGAGLVVLGIVLGLVAALALARFLGAFLHGVGSSDPLALAAASVMLLLVGLAAAFIPAYRASRVDLVSVLKDQ